MPTAEWYSPLYDRVLLKVKIWHEAYDKGEVNATCKFNDPVHGLIDKPTRYAHRIPWTTQEFDALLRVMEIGCENKVLVEELRYIRKNILPHGQLTLGNARFVTMSFYQEHVQLMLQVLLEAKNGQQRTIESYGEEGKSLFE